MKLNLFFVKLYLGEWDTSLGKKFGFDKKGDDYCITFGRRELWVIPPNSSSYFEE